MRKIRLDLNCQTSTKPKHQHRHQPRPHLVCAALIQPNLYPLASRGGPDSKLRLSSTGVEGLGVRDLFRERRVSRVTGFQSLGHGGCSEFRVSRVTGFRSLGHGGCSELRVSRVTGFQSLGHGGVRLPASSNRAPSPCELESFPPHRERRQIPV